MRDLGIHTEMLVDGMIDLDRGRRSSPARARRSNPCQIVFTFAAGSRRLYDFIDRNPRVQRCPVDYTNLPHNIMQNDRVVSINNTTQIDLQGQAASESDGPPPPDRHRRPAPVRARRLRVAAAASRSSASRRPTSGAASARAASCSTLTPGNVVTTPRTDVMYVVTEYGIVNLKGKSVAERAKALIGIAHPDFREELEREAREQNLIPKGFF